MATVFLAGVALQFAREMRECLASTANPDSDWDDQ
jgi:hypothetical protein